MTAEAVACARCGDPVQRHDLPGMQCSEIVGSRPHGAGVGYVGYRCCCPGYVAPALPCPGIAAQEGHDDG